MLAPEHSVLTLVLLVTFFACLPQCVCMTSVEGLRLRVVVLEASLLFASLFLRQLTRSRQYLA